MNAQGKWRPENDLEWQHAKRIADVVLDRINADPDDDIAVLARQLLRKAERIETNAQGSAAHNALCAAEPVAWFTPSRVGLDDYMTRDKRTADSWSSAGCVVTPLYSAPPPSASAVAKVEEYSEQQRQESVMADQKLNKREIAERCDQCGGLFLIGLLDGKPDHLAGPKCTAADLAEAADRGEDFLRLECRECYGSAYTPGDE